MFSAGEFIDYHRCPAFYRFRHIWGYQPGIAIELGFGKSIHEILRLIGERARNGADPEAVLDSIVNSEFYLPYADRGTTATLREKARKALREYVKGHKADMAKIEQVEMRIEFLLEQKVAITGKVDVIHKQDGILEIREYKTDDDPRTIDNAQLQLRLYALGLKNTGRPLKKASLALVMENKILDVDVGSDAVAAAENLALECAGQLLAGFFPAKTGNYCKLCDYFNICPKAKAALDY